MSDATTKMADAIESVIGPPVLDEDEFGPQMAALCEVIARRVVHVLKRTGSSTPHASIMSAAQIAATSVSTMATELFQKGPMR